MLEKNFFRRDALTVAPDLLGKVLVREKNGEEIRFVIMEVEAYDGEEDSACHASRGRTPRTEAMYGPAGFWYVYLVYGMHYMLNITTGEEGYPSAVLIRGAREVTGPGRLTRALSVDASFNAKEASKDTGLWIEEGTISPSLGEVEKTPRIGVDYAGEWASKPYRFVWKDNLKC